MAERTLISFDWALKSILRQKDNFDILEGFLTDLLNEKITIIDLLESESNKDSKIDKLNRVDLKAKDASGREIIVEVQYNSEVDYFKRVFFGVSRSIAESMTEGYRYDKVKKVISVSIVYFGALQEGYIARGKIKFDDMRGNTVSVKGEEGFAEYYFIQPKWFDDNVKDRLDEWVYIFKHSKVREGAVATNIEKVAEKLDRLKMTEREYRNYIEYMDNVGINEAQLHASREEGREEGRKEGEEKIEKLIEALRKSGMSDNEIGQLINENKSEK